MLAPTMNMLDLIALKGLGVAYSALPIAFVIYVLLLMHSRAKDSPAADDTQLGIKTVAAMIAIVATGLFAVGFQAFLHVILTFDDFGTRIKAALPNVVFGGLGVVAAGFVLFPRTNAEQYPKAKRLTAGMVALVAGGAMLPLLAMFLDRLLNWPSWNEVAGALSAAVVSVAIFGAAFNVLGRLSGINMKADGPGMGQGIEAGNAMQVAAVPQPAAAQPSYPAQPAMPDPGQYPPQGYPAQGQYPQGQYPQPPQGQGQVPPGWNTPGG